MILRFAMAVVVSLALFVAVSPNCNAGLINGGFEDGDLTGWNASDETLVSLVGSYTSYGPVFTPVEGNYFALVSAGAGEDVYTVLSQPFQASAGEVLSMNAFFQANDYLPNNDSAYVRLLDSGSNVVATLFQSDVATVGDLGNTSWTPIVYTFSAAGNYRLEAGVANFGDNEWSSVMGIDNAQVVPVPSTWLGLLSLGGAGILGCIWRRHRRS